MSWQEEMSWEDGPPPAAHGPPIPSSPGSRGLRAEPGQHTPPVARAPSPRPARGAPPARVPHSPTARMRKPRGGRSARRHQASRSTCRLAGGACTSSTPRRSQPWKASREAARASREFQKQRALARRNARKIARPPGSSVPAAAASSASSLHSTSASEPGASCTGRAMPPRVAGARSLAHGRERAPAAGGIGLLRAAPAAGGTGSWGRGRLCSAGRGVGRDARPGSGHGPRPPAPNGGFQGLSYQDLLHPRQDSAALPPIASPTPVSLCTSQLPGQPRAPLPRGGGASLGLFQVLRGPPQPPRASFNRGASSTASWSPELSRPEWPPSPWLWDPS